MNERQPIRKNLYRAIDFVTRASLKPVTSTDVSPTEFVGYAALYTVGNLWSVRINLKRGHRKAAGFALLMALANALLARYVWSMRYDVRYQSQSGGGDMDVRR